MQSKITLLFITFFSLFSLISDARSEPSVQKSSRSAVTSMQEQGASYRGMLYRVHHEGRATYLFGTIHAGQRAFYPLDPQTMKAFSDSSRLVVEFDPGNTQAITSAVMRYGFYSGSRQLDSQLTARGLKKLKQSLPRFDLSFDQIARMKPWMVANLMIARDVERDGVSMQQGVEPYLLEMAKQHNKEVMELETAGYQLSLFDMMTEAQQEAYLTETLEEIQSGEADRKTKRLLNAWKKGNGEVFEEELKELTAEKTVSAHFTRTILLSRRNGEMADKINALLKTGSSSFIAVGLLHLVGKDGLPELLRQKGYHVKRLH